MSVKPLVASLLLLATGLAGCALWEPDKPELTVFRVDEIRYWFEGDDRMVVNVTITNQVNFTPSGIHPSLRVAVEEWLGKPGNRPGDDTRPGDFVGFTLVFVPDTPTSRQSEGRWILDERDPRGMSAGAENGPIRITPGMSITREFEFPHNVLREQVGYYVIRLDTRAHFPDGWYPEYDTNSFGHYYSGCFNHDVAEFYGVREGLDCYYWDCTGRNTRVEHAKFKEMGKVREEAMPDCSATNGTGPYHD